MSAPLPFLELRPDTLDSAAAHRLILQEITELDLRYPEQVNGGRLESHEVVPPSGVFLVAWAGKDAIGCGAIRRISDNTAEVKRMFVEPTFRGHGVARRILAKLEETARNAGYAVVRLETGERQPEAIGLYTSSGYHRIPAFGPYVGSRFSVCFEKNLADPTPPHAHAPSAHSSDHPPLDQSPS